MILKLSKFPKFKFEYANYETWGASLRNNGYPSARLSARPYDQDEYYDIDNLEYMLFILKWS
jgi:hypothetical protein